MVDLVGEALLLVSLLIAPWVYGSVEDSVRFCLCAVVLASAGLILWPNLRKGRIPRGVGLAFAFPLFATIQVLLNQTVAPWTTVEAALVGFAMAMTWAAVDASVGSTSTNRGRRLAVGLLILCASEAAFAAFQWSADRTALFGRRHGLQTMPFGSYVNHNNFAGLVSLAVPLALAMAIGDLRRSGRLTPRGLLLIGLAAGLALTVFASGSRGGAVAMVLGSGALAYISRRAGGAKSSGHSRVAAGLVVALVTIVAFLATPSATRSRFVALLNPTGTVDYRIDIGVAAFRAFLDRPLMGSGLGAFADAATPFKTGYGDVRSERAEADLLEFLVEGGVAMAAALVAFALFVWRTFRAETLGERSHSGRWLRAGAMAACATMMIHSLFDFGFRIPANALAFSVLLGIATAGSTTPAGRGKRATAFVLAAIGAGALACAYRSMGAVDERVALARATPESRLDALEHVVEAHPYLEKARRQRGLAWMALAYSRGQYEATRLARARSDLEAVVATRPQWGEAWADLGWIKYFQGDLASATQDMEKAARFDPTHVGVGIAGAQLLAWSGNLPGALEKVAALRKMNPQWSRASARELVASWTKDTAILSNVP